MWVSHSSAETGVVHETFQRYGVSLRLWICRLLIRFIPGTPRTPLSAPVVRGILQSCGGVSNFELILFVPVHSWGDFRNFFVPATNCYQRDFPWPRIFYRALLVFLIRHNLRRWGFKAAVPSVSNFWSFALRCVPCFDGLDRVHSCHLVDVVCALLLQRPNLSSGFVSIF